VVPIFRRQIERGGPLTVTDERMTRYFMTIPEAVQLIIRSGSLASELRVPGDRPPGANVFVLEMGEPVRIVDLARAMIELSGLDADRDIDIEIVGARPGEKVHEALFNGYERPRPTAAEKILLADRQPLAVEEVESMFGEIVLLVLEGDAAGLAAKVSELSAERREAHEAIPAQPVDGGGSQDGAGAHSAEQHQRRTPIIRPPEPTEEPAAEPTEDGVGVRGEQQAEAQNGRREAPPPLVHSPNS
jgi:FlaA1/EpsC-like NDP-sugar epimerase